MTNQKVGRDSLYKFISRDKDIKLFIMIVRLTLDHNKIPTISSRHRCKSERIKYVTN